MDADELGPARQFSPRDVGQPIAQFGDRAVGIAAMGVDVHARQIRDEALVAILLDVEDQRALACLVLVAEVTRAEKDAEFERHVEAGKAVRRVQFGAREIVDTVSAVLNDRIELVDTGLAGVVQLARRARDEPTGVNSEDQRAEQRRVIVVEGAIDEDAVDRRAGMRGQASASC